MNIKPTFEVISTSHSDLIHDVQVRVLCVHARGCACRALVTRAPHAPRPAGSTTTTATSLPPAPRTNPFACGSSSRRASGCRRPNGRWEVPPRPAREFGGRLFLTLAPHKAHDGSVWKIAWAPPEYGDIFATASYDRTVIVWERSAVKVGPKGMAKWASRARLVDARQSVTDIA